MGKKRSGSCKIQTQASGGHCTDSGLASSSVAAVEPESYLSLGEAEGAGQLGPFRKGQVLRPLEPPLQLLDLQRGVDRPGLPHLLALAVYPRQLPVLYALLDVI